MSLEDLATTNEYIIHELVKHLNSDTLLSLRGTCKTIEQILNSNSAFIEKAFRSALLKKLGTSHGYVPYDTKQLRQFIFKCKTDAQEKLQFARKMIHVSEQTSMEWEQYQGQMTKIAALQTFVDMKDQIRKNWGTLNETYRNGDKEFEKLQLTDNEVNMHTDLTKIFLHFKYAEEDLAKIIREREYRKYVTRPKSWRKKRNNQNRASEQKRRITNFKYLAFHSARILQLLLKELMEIQNSYLSELMI